MKKKIGIVGTGNSVSIGYFHAMGLIDEDRCEIVAVLNRSLERSEKFITDLKLNAKAYTDYEIMLEDVDGVIICTPNDSHVDYAVKAMEKGVGVLLEKPLSNDFSKCKKLVETAERTGAFSMIGYTNRFNNQVETLSSFVKKNIGKIFTIDMTYGGERQANPQVEYEWRHNKAQSGSGALVDYGAHAVDLIKVICGVEIAKVNCMVNTCINERKDANGTVRIVETDDVAVVNAVGTGGELCSMTMSRVGHNGCEMTVIGECGKIIANVKDNKFKYLKKAKDGGYESQWLQLESPAQDMKFGAFKKQNTAFIDGLFNINNSQVCSVTDAYYVEKVLNCCVKSSKNDSVVTV